MAKKKKAAAAEAEMSVSETLPVQFGNVSIGEKTCRVGITIDRRNLGLGAADRTLCGKRLAGSILARANGGPDQESLPGADDDIELAGIYDVKAFSVTAKALSCGLTFSLESIDLTKLGHFAKRSGLLKITSIGKIPADAPKDDPADGDDDE